ncbi:MULTISPECIES: multicopper oxidase family protein [unclassified Leifsonia]|uniref:multicopper oxidase family protein n=1 Tax=unclassified Leifsonia TaxID=2663824 RepID=UPI000375BFE5|nr:MULTISPECIES: multicopper oxidase domain-containing protein [unclassified Leifsonia]TDQ03597.1 cell division protein SufI [Leifsonia sp. 115AMFTsu3.1]
MTSTPPPRLRRPRASLIALGLTVALAVTSAATLAACSGLGAGTIDTAGKVDFDTRLPVPALAVPTVEADGTKTFELDARAGTTEFLPGTKTTTWGFDGSYLGPTLVADRGDEVRVRVTNHLTEETSVHWHGMHLPARMDGGPHQMVSPGEVWEPHWRIDQPAATLWYHPHLHGRTEQHVQLGMAGMFLVRDPQEAALALPRTYGVDDLPVIVQDKRFGSDGQFTDSTSGFIGPIGDTLVVNGAIGPYAEVTTDRVRLRLLNASAARTYDFGFSDRRTVQLIATDGGLLPAPVALDHIRLPPGERAEIVVAVQPGERAVLRSFPPDLGLDGPLPGMNAGTDTLDVLQLRAAASLEHRPDVPAALAPAEPLPKPQVTRTFRLDGHEINGRKMESGRIDETVTVDTAEEWVVTNTMDLPHSFHVHDVQFRIASIGGAPPPPELAGWKDTVYLPPQTEFRLLLQFADYTDPDAPYMYHCHLLAHEDAGMMGQFVVVRPGEHAGVVPEDTTAPHGGSGPRKDTSHDH